MSPEELHYKAMNYTDQAFAWKAQGNQVEFINFIKKAFRLEREAALKYRKLEKAREPTTSVLLRSAASLAFLCKKYWAARPLIDAALEGDPPPDIETELLDLKRKIEDIRETAVYQFKDIREHFVVASLYHLMGKDHACVKTFGKDFGDELERNYFTNRYEDTGDNKQLEEILRGQFNYVNHVYFYDTRGRGLKETPVYERNFGNKDFTEDNLDDVLLTCYEDLQTSLNKIYGKKDNSDSERENYIEEKGYCKENDSKNGGISRDPFKSKPRYLSDLDFLVAITIYLLRGHCCFWLEESVLGKDINCAKAALNDFLQAYYLTQRFFRIKKKNAIDSSEIDSDLSFEIEDDYLRNLEHDYFARKIEQGDYDAIIMIYFVLIDIFRGNIYSKIYNYDTALNCYQRAIDQFESSVSGLFNPDELDDSLMYIEIFMCKTIVKMRVELGRMHFEMGQFVRSLRHYLKALEGASILSLEETGGAKWDKCIELFEKIQHAVKYLRFDEKQSVHSKPLIRRYFEKESSIEKYFEDCEKAKLNFREISKEKNSYMEQREGISPIRKENVTSLIKDEYKHIVGQLFDLIANDLMILREKVIVIKGTEKTKDYEAWSEILEARNERYIKQFKNVWSRYQGRPDKIEDIFTDSMYEALKKKKKRRAGRKDSLVDFFLDIGSVSIESIANMVKVPRMIHSILTRRGYKHRVRRQVDEVADKFVVLRRWQSYNPSVPRHERHRIPGGGYFLIWKETGIVIDPGFGFIQNFYDEGFSIEDIDVILITHSHPDHTAELNTLLTLIFEWNEFWKDMPDGVRADQKKVDLYLNESSFRKYETWIHSPMGVVKSVHPLTANAWIENGVWKKGGSILLDLNEKYHLNLEVIPVRHDDILSKDTSIGVKFHLLDEKSSFVVGITSDTGAYKEIGGDFKDSDILVAHLGDIKLRNFMEYTKMRSPYDIIGKIFNGNYTRDKVLDFIKFMSELDLLNWREVYEEFIENEKISEKDQKKLREFFKGNISGEEIYDLLHKLINKIIEKSSKLNKEDKERVQHLGIKGTLDLFEAVSDYRENNGGNALFIIGEFPEELGSYRQLVARLLNDMNEDSRQNRMDSYPDYEVRCFTGDIGLHVGLGINKDHRLSVRCYQCNQNNELIKNRSHYHPVAKIQETVVKNLQGAMIYLCTENHHAMMPIYKPEFFMNFPLPDIRYIVL